MKKVLLGLLTLVVLFSLASCNFGSNKIISFESNGGSKVASITAKPGDAISKPADPTKEDLTFGGWYADIDLLDAYVFPEKMPDADIKLYAKWVSTLTFDCNGGPAVEPIIGEGGKTYKMPEDPVREGYVFVGWFTDKAYTQRLTYVMPKTNTTAYAKWQVYETGSSIPVSLDLADNDGVFTLTKLDGGIKITATASKTEWGYCYSVINMADKHNTTIKVQLIGKKDTNVTLKLEGGNAESATETTATLTGELQEVVWSCEEANLSTVAGQRFLVFLNGGVVGCDEAEPEWVEIKSVTLYRTKDAEDEQKAAIYFIPNGGSDVEEIYVAPGTAITAPAAPTRPGYKFLGWFADAELTQEYTFDKMPAAGAVVYAGWEKEKEIKADVSLMNLDIYGLTPDTYEITKEEGKYVIKKLAAGGEWDCVAFPMPEGADLGGYTFLRAEIVGPAGTKVLFKVNDTKEKWVDMTGSKQILDLEFEHTFDMTKFALVFFANGGTAGETGEFTITKLAYGNHAAIVNLIGEGWEGNEQTATTYAIADGKLTLSKASVGDGSMDWDCIKFRTATNLEGFNKLHITVKGPAGEQLLAKIYDSKECWINTDGTAKEYVFDFDLNYDANKPALVLFAQPGKDGNAGAYEITDAYLEFAVAPAKAPVEEADLIVGALEIGSSHEAQVELVIAKTAAGEWENVAVDAAEKIAGATKLIAKVKGEDGKKVLFKVNDQKEFWVECDGTLQVIERDIEAFNWDATRHDMIIFPEAMGAGTGAKFVISELKLQNGEDVYDLMKGAYAQNACIAERRLTMLKKAEDPNQWDCIKISTGLDLSLINVFKYKVQGTAGEQILFKVNDAKEQFVNLDGTIQEGKIDLTGFSFDKTKAELVLFANPGVSGTGNPIYLTLLAFEKEETAPAEEVREANLIEGEFIIGGSHEVQKYVVVSKKNAGDWDNISVALDGIEGATKLSAAIEGPAGKQILLKLNDQKEFFVTCTGAVQLINEDIVDLTWNAEKKAMYIFPECATAGEGAEFKIYLLEVVNGETRYNLMNGEFTKGVCEIKNSFGVAKKADDTNAWDCIKINSGKDLSKIDVLLYEIKGTAGEQVLIKINDSKEAWINLNGEVQQGKIDLSDFAFDATKPDIVIFCNPGVNGTGNFVLVNELRFAVEADLPVVLEDIDLLQGALTVPAKNHADYILVCGKNGGSEWDWVGLDGLDITGINKLQVEVEGDANTTICFKLNDAKEYKVDCDGTVQALEFDVTDLAYDQAKKEMIIFPDFAIAGVGTEFIITKLVAVCGENTVNLLDGELSVGNPNSIMAKKAIAISKDADNANEWDCILIAIDGDLTGYNKISYLIQGTKDEKILLKANDNGAGEKMITIANELADGSYTFNFAWDNAKKAIVIFANPIAAGTGHPFIIYELTLSHAE